MSECVPTTVIEAKCTRCRDNFSYCPKEGKKPRPNRVVCPRCKRRVLQAGLRRYRERLKLLPPEDSIAVLDSRGITRASREEVALAWHVTTERIRQIERTALAKLRSNSCLRRVYAGWIADGAPVPRHHAEAGQMLLEWQLELCNWRDGLEILRAEADCQEEAKELEEAIDACQVLVGRAVEEQMGIDGNSQ